MGEGTPVSRVPSLSEYRARRAEQRDPDRPAATRWREPSTGFDLPDTGVYCPACRLPLHPILIRDGERWHLLCRPEPVKHWRLR